MTWATAKSILPGWYWWKGHVWGQERTKIFEVCKDRNGLYVSGFSYVDMIGGQWAGPLPAPEEA